MPPPQLDDSLRAHTRPSSPLLSQQQSPSLLRPLPPPLSQASPLLSSQPTPLLTTKPYNPASILNPTSQIDPLSPSPTAAEEIPGIPQFGELYSGYSRMSATEPRPSKPFSHLEEEERAPQLTDERESVIKLWVENLPITNEATLQEALSLLVEHPITVSGIDVVTERGMIATKSAFLTVDFGINDREKIFYKLENFGLTIKGMRCPVRTAEVKRSLTLIELGQISEEALVTALRDYDIKYQTYDYPGRYISPQRQVAFPYRGSVLLTFRSHDEAYLMKQRFDSDEGVVIGDRRIYAMWGPRAGSMPLEIRTAANYMRNLIWENRDLRKYVSNARQVNSGWKEPQGFNKLSDMFEKQHKTDIQRQSTLEDLKKQLDETKLVLKKVQKTVRAPRNEEGEEQEQEQEQEEGEEEENVEEILSEANDIIAKAKQFEEKLHVETMVGRLQGKTVLDEIGTTRSISPFVPRIEDNMGLSQVEEEFDKSFAALKAKHDSEFKRLREVHNNARKKVVQEVFAKNHRNVGITAEELGVSRARISKDTRLKPSKKTPKRKKKVVEETASIEAGEGESESVQAAETEGGQGETEGGEVRESLETESGQAETEGGEAREEMETEGGEAKENINETEDSDFEKKERTKSE